MFLRPKELFSSHRILPLLPMDKVTPMLNLVLLLLAVCDGLRGQELKITCSAKPSMSPSGLLSMVHTQVHTLLYDLHIVLKGDNRHLVLESIYCDYNLQQLWTVKAQLFKYNEQLKDFIAFMPQFTPSTGFAVMRGPDNKFEVKDLDISPGSITVKAASSRHPLQVILKITKALKEGADAVRGLMPIPKDYKSRATESYYAVVHKKATQENAIHVFDEFGAYVRTISFGKIDFFRGIYPSIPRAKDGYHLGFFEFMEGITSVVLFRVTDTAFEFNYNYMILEELAGCPPPVCYKDRFTEIVEYSNGAKGIYFTLWHFRFDGAYKKVDYTSAEKYTETTNRFWLRPGLFNSYLDADQRVYIIFGKDGVLILTNDPKKPEVKKKSETHLKDIPSGEALFYWKKTATLYHFNSFSVGGIDLKTKKLLPKKSLEDFFGFNIYDNYKDRPPIVDVYLEKEVVYVFVYNWFVSFSASSFSETGHFFKPKEVIKRKCVSEFLGCPVVKPRAGVPDERGYFPCGQVNGHTWDLRLGTNVTTTVGGGKSTDQSRKTATEGQSKDKPPGAVLLIIGVLVFCFLLIIGILVGALFFLKKRNKELKKKLSEDEETLVVGSATASTGGSTVGPSISSRPSTVRPSKVKRGKGWTQASEVQTVNSTTGQPNR